MEEVYLGYQMRINHHFWGCFGIFIMLILAS